VKATTTLNLALRKPTKMSSTLSSFISSRAVNGNKDNSNPSNTCSHTCIEEYAWWQVDLLAIYLIKDVVITNQAGSKGQLELNQIKLWHDLTNLHWRRCWLQLCIQITKN